MTAPHFFAADLTSSSVALHGEEARHAVRVLRLKPGEEITVSDGRGQIVRATVTHAGKDLVADVTGRRSEPAPRPRLYMYPAIPKAGKLDLVVQKLTELGVDVIQPFPAARSVSRWDPAKAQAQTARLSAIAREAAKQSRRAWLPEVLPPRAIDRLELPAASYVLDEEAAAGFGAALPAEPPESVGIVVGPEGGLEREEVAALTARGVAAVSLGRLILRTETAALVAATIVGFRFGRLA